MDDYVLSLSYGKDSLILTLALYCCCISAGREEKEEKRENEDESSNDVNSAEMV